MSGVNTEKIITAPASFLEELKDALTDIFLSPGESSATLSAIDRIKIVLYIFIGLVIIGIIAYFSIKIASKDPIPSQPNVSLAIAKRMNEMKGDAQRELLGQKSFYEGLLKTIPANQRYLINCIPLTASLGGYIGNNVFYSNEYIQRALKAGIRSFILPVSTYLDDNKRPPNWPLSGKPAIVVRNREGKITSINALTIAKFCQEILSFKASNPTQSEEPYFIFLEEDIRYTPNHSKQEREYVVLMSEIAKELEVLKQNRLLHLGQYGSATEGGAKSDKILLETPLEDFRGKVVIFSNFDTKLQLKDAYANITPRLHEYINISVAPNRMELISLGEGLGDDKKFEEKTRNVYYMASKRDTLEIPSAEDVRQGITKGIQGIPLPFFAVPNAELEKHYRLWEGYSMIFKPEAIRFTKPSPVVPALPSASLNARVDGAKVPGEIIIR